MKWFRVHIKEDRSYRNLPENLEGSEGLHRRSPQEQNRSRVRREVSVHWGRSGVEVGGLEWVRTIPGTGVDIGSGGGVVRRWP